MNKKIKIIELFSGIGSQTKALSNINIDHEVISIADWDIYACISYALVHQTKKFSKLYDKWLAKHGKLTLSNEQERERERERETFKIAFKMDFFKRWEIPHCFFK